MQATQQQVGAPRPGVRLLRIFMDAATHTLRTSARGPLKANTSRAVSLSSGHASTGGGRELGSASASARTSTTRLVDRVGRVTMRDCEAIDHRMRFNAIIMQCGD